MNQTKTLPAWLPIFGADVWERLEADKAARVPRSEFYPDCFQSDPLCDWQSEMHARGFVVAKLEKHSLGYSLRYASGLDGFNRIASVRDGTLDGTREHALAYAEAWHAAAPSKRVVLEYLEL